MDRIKPWEIAAIAALAILFLVSASVNMGARSMPSSSWQPSTAVPTADSEAEEIEAIFDFGSVQHITELYVFLADEKRTKFELYAGTAPDAWSHVVSFDRNPDDHVHFSSWDRITLGNKSARYLKFVFSPESDGHIGEMVLVSAANEQITPVNVTGAGAQRLTDEQEVVTLPITQQYGAYFDEMYFVRTAQEHLQLEEPYEWTHPPLGKLMISLGILLFGMNPFGWRILGVLVAAAMIPLMFLFGKRMFNSSVAGFIAAFLLTLDFMHFSLARLATGEIYLAFFSLLMFYFAFEYVSSQDEAELEDDESVRRRSRSLFLSMVFFGLGFAVKWTAVFGLFAVLILVLVRNVHAKDSLSNDSKTIVAGLFAAAAIYLATYIPYMLSGGGHALIDLHQVPAYFGYLVDYVSSGTVNTTSFTSSTVFDLQLRMFGYHAGIEATHPYSSPWWSWPLMLKPLWMYANTLTNEKVSTIVLMGNPALWWSSILAFIALGATVVATNLKKAGDKRTSVLLFILVPFLLQWLSYALITRILFIYHFAANVPFMILAVTYWLQLPFEHEWSSRNNRLFVTGLVITFLILVAALFFLFYPVLSGYPVTNAYKEGLRWLSGWTF